MSSSYKPPAQTKTEGFTPLAQNQRFDSKPIYRVVEVVRNSEGRLRHEGRVWHNDLALLRKFGRAVAANTSSHRVMITDAVGDIIEELPIAAPDERQSAWDSWEGVDLPPAPPVVRRARVEKQRPLNVLGAGGRPPAEADNEVDLAIALATEAIAAAPASADPPAETMTAASTPPRDLPKLDMGTAEPIAGPVDDAVPMVPQHEATLP